MKKQSKDQLQSLIKRLKSNGYQYYINQMVIHYGKEKYNKRMECDYLKEIGGKVDYEKGFQRIIEREKLK